MLLGWVILTKRLTSFQVAGEMRIVNDKQTSSVREVQDNITPIVEEQ